MTVNPDVLSCFVAGAWGVVAGLVILAALEYRAEARIRRMNAWTWREAHLQALRKMRRCRGRRRWRDLI